MEDGLDITEEMRVLAQVARRLANDEFRGGEQEVGFCTGLAGRDPDDVLHLLALELGRPLDPEERRLFDVGYRVGAIDRVREDERAADVILNAFWEGVPT